MASWVGGETASPAQLDRVARAIRKTPIIDHHAHPLLKTEALRRRSLLSISTEASGDALAATPTTLSHLRAVKQLSAMLGCDATWEAVVAAIEEKHSGPYGEWVRSCLTGIETILIDDGLDSGDDAFAYSWHDSYTRGKCKRIVRIEKVAMDIMVQAFTGQMLVPGENSTSEMITFLMGEFCHKIQDSLEDPDVVGFKSVICYRTGLAVPKCTTLKEASQGFNEAWADFGRGKFKRVQYVHLNNYLVQETARLISGSQHKKPLQFHTGLGDSDIILSKSSPAHLQEFIQANPLVPIVLLHASYPFTREAGYLASVYANVYADIGEVFPCVSQAGQETVLRQILELAPFSKILWSTDGHWFPETYALAVRQMREVFQTVLLEYMQQGHIGWEAAIALIRHVLFENSNKLYQLGLKLVELADDEEDSGHGNPPAYPYLERFDALLPPGISCDFVRICWTDFTATRRMRMIPFRKFTSLLREGRSVDIGIAKASLGMLQNDMMVSGASATGEYRLYPDFESLKRGPVDGHVSMYGDFREASGAEVAICPRSLLRSTVELGIENKLTFALGFEIEFLLVERLGDSAPSRFASLQADGHAWSVSQYYADPKISRLLGHMVTELSKAGIYVEQVHAESTPGQFEVVLPPLPPVEAVDTLLHAREIMSALATAAGYRMTLHPKPAVNACGTAAHTHMSISSADGSKPEVYEPFYAGILGHLPAILAFTYSNPLSYERIGDGVFSGGRWVAWGTQNRETPLRKIEDSHWELKCVDGLANMYLAMSAVLQAGMHGVLSKDKLVWGDCQTDPAGLTSDQREKLVVTQQLPATLPAALSALQKDARLPKLMGAELVDRYIAVKDAEIHLLGNMGNEERRQWIMERY